MSSLGRLGVRRLIALKVGDSLHGVPSRGPIGFRRVDRADRLLNKGSLSEKGRGTVTWTLRYTQNGYRPQLPRFPIRMFSHPTSSRYNPEDPTISAQYRRPAMPTVVYSLDNAIDSFFSEAGASSSKKQCDDVVRRRYGGQIWPVDIQGSSSYTVITGRAATRHPIPRAGCLARYEYVGVGQRSSRRCRA